MNIKNKTILAHVFHYASAQYFSQFLGFFTSIMLRKFLGPVSMGIWSMLNVIKGYVGYATLGVASAVPYKLPILKGQGKFEEIRSLTSVIFNYITLVTFVCSTGVMVYALIFKGTLSKEVFVGLLMLAILLVAQRIYTYYITLLRANRNFGVLSKDIVFDAVLNLFLMILIVSKFRLYGFYLVLILTPILNVIFIRRYVTYDLRFSFDLKGIFGHIKYVLPLCINGVLDQILHSIDKIMIASMLGLEQLGFYSIALMTETYGTGIARNFSIVIQPHFLEDFGANGLEKSSQQVVLYSQVTAYFMAIFLSLTFIFAPVLVVYVLPAFIPGIMSLQIFLLAIFFFTITPYSNNLLVALEKQSKLIPITILSILVNISLNYLFIKKGYGINGVALATAISAFVSFCVLSGYALAHCRRKVIIASLIFKVISPLVYSVLCLAIVTMIKYQKYMILEAMFRAAVFMVFVLPLIVFIDKKTNVVKLLWKIFSEKMGWKAAHHE